MTMTPGRRLSLALCCLLVASAPSVLAQGLESLALQVTGGAELVPAFEPARTSYRSVVLSDIDTLGLAARPAAPGAVLKLSVDGRTADPRTPMRVPLSVGANRVELRVDDASGNPLGRYEITVEREDIRPVAERFQKRTFADATTGRSMPYRLFAPDGASAGAPLPLVVFLHGSGERGDDNEKPLLANQGGTIWAKPAEQALHPAYVLVPQARNAWTGGFAVTRNADNRLDLSNVLRPSEDLATVQRLLRQVLSENAGIDRKRLYLTGLSQGGFGAWAWSQSEPDLFAAMVTVCSGGDPALAPQLRGKPVWAFHAEADPVVPVEFSRRSIAALRAAGAEPHYTEYDAATYFFPGAHGAWVMAYRDTAMRAWLFGQGL